MSQLAVTGNGAGTGVFTLTSPNSNTNRTLTLPDNTGTLLSTKSAGTVLQVVQTTSSTQVSTTSTSMVTSGISASITPTSSSSKILVLVSVAMGTTSTGGVGFSIARNGTVVWNPMVNDSSGFYGMYSTASARWIGSIQYLDSPATTSATTYAIYYAARSNTTFINETGISNNGGSSITLMEIAA